MKSQKSAGIVLRRWAYSENSQILRILTPEMGAISLLAKGVHRLKSGALGVYDTWALVEIEFGGKNNADLFHLHRGKLLDRMSGLSRDTKRLAAAGVLAEIAELGAPPGQPAPGFFLWLQRWLHHLAEGAAIDPLLCAALLEGLDRLGLAPELRPPQGSPDGVFMWFAPAAGGLVVNRDGSRPEHHARRIQPEELLFLQSLEKNPEVCLDSASDNASACLTILGEFLHYHLERPPKAWQLLHRKGIQPTLGP